MLPGAGAAGGLGAGLAAFAGAALRSGIDLVLSAYGDFEEHCADAAAIISGEGRVDGQSTQGKVLSGVAGVARRHGVPLFVLAGKISGDLQTLYDAGVTAVFPIAPFPMEEKEALRTAAAHLEQTARNLMRTVAALKRKKQ
jgi:glycerate kinase